MMFIKSMTYLFHNWKFISLNSLHLLHSTANHLLLWQPPVFSLYQWLCFSFGFCSFVLVFIFTYKWIYTMFIFLWFISLSIILTRSIHVVANSKISFFFYHWVIFLYIYIIFFIHSSNYGHLGCIHILTIVYKAAVNIKVCISFQMSVFISSDKYPEVELLDYMIALFLIFWGKSVFSRVAVQIYIPTNSVQGFLFLHIFANTDYLLPF